MEEQTAVLTRFSGPPASFLSGEVGAGASTIAATGGSASVAKRKGPTASARDVEDVGSSDRAGK